MPRPKAPPTPDTPVEALYNLSDKTAAWLRSRGIETFADLRDADLVEVWCSLKAEHRQVTRLMYWAMWGAVHNCHWRDVPEEEKAAFEAALAARG